MIEWGGGRLVGVDQGVRSEACRELGRKSGRKTRKKREWVGGRLGGGDEGVGSEAVRERSERMVEENDEEERIKQTSGAEKIYIKR